MISPYLHALFDSYLPPDSGGHAENTLNFFIEVLNKINSNEHSEIIKNVKSTVENSLNFINDLKDTDHNWINYFPNNYTFNNYKEIEDYYLNQHYLDRIVSMILKYKKLIIPTGWKYHYSGHLVSLYFNYENFNDNGA